LKGAAADLDFLNAGSVISKSSLNDLCLKHFA
jgi:hypothetical protein